MSDTCRRRVTSKQRCRHSSAQHDRDRPAGRHTTAVLTDCCSLCSCPGFLPGRGDTAAVLALILAALVVASLLITGVIP